MPHRCESPRRPEEGVPFPGGISIYELPNVGVGTELALSGKAASAMNHRAISSGPHTLLKRMKFKMRWRYRPEESRSKSECVKPRSPKRNMAG